MNEFTETHSDHLLSKEWLVKIDNEKSIPYLMKLHSAFADQSCIFLITDTKTVWVEVLSRQQLSHRWSMLNPSNALDYSSRPDDDNWLDQVLQYLTDVHSPSVISNLSFNVIDSRYSELGVDLRGETFKWRWETFSVGPKQSAHILSKHLIMPLLSTAYLAFTSSDAISEISDCDLEQAIDRIGRTARRSVDTHIRNIFSQSRICTSIRRISALFAFSANLPAVVEELERPELILPSVDFTARSERSQTPHKTLTLPVSSVNIEQAQSHDLHVRGSTNVAHEVKLGPREALNNNATQQDPGRYIPSQATTGDGESSTETGEDDDKILVPPRRQLGKGRGTARPTVSATQSKKASQSSHSGPSALGSHAPTAAPRSGAASTSLASDSPSRPAKRARPKRQNGSDYSSEDGAKRSEERWRGTKQPIKRVGRQF